MKYFNIGSETEIGGYAKLTRLGQTVELPEAIFWDAVRGGALLLPEADFKHLGITDEELEKYPTAGLQRFAPEELREKIKAGGLIAHKMRTGDWQPKPADKPGATVKESANG